MSDPTFQDLKELIIGLDKKNQELKELILGLDRTIMGLDRKIDIQFIELKSDIKSVEERLGGEIRLVEERLGSEIKLVEERLGGEIKEVKEKLNGIDKRIGNEEFISRGALTAVFVSVAAGVIKYLFSTPNSIS